MAYKHSKAWRLKNPDKRNEEKKLNYKQTQYDNLNSYRRWDQHDDMLVMYANITDRELHSQIGRSVQAIQIRRTRLKHSLVETAGVI